jgi:transketolase
MDSELKASLSKIANTIRDLAMDATQKANSGHPGLPMGCAEFGAYLWGHFLHYDCKDPHWVGRDRFVLSAGHGCLLQYISLHLAGYDLSLDQLKRFRQLHSLTPGHPEYGETPGIEITTGPLGQGVGCGVGLALGLKILAEKFNTPKYPLFNQKVVVLAGDGCMMEGVASEASSLGGHLSPDNLILVYDANKICLDGPIAECLSEDTLMRYKAYGWQTYELDGYDFDAMDSLFSSLRDHQERPAFVLMHTIIGKGSPNKAGTNKVHGNPLGEDEVRLTKEALGLPMEPFFVSQAVRDFFSHKRERDRPRIREWQDRFEAWTKEVPDRYEVYKAMRDHHLPDDLEGQLRKIEIKAPIAGRAASEKVLQHLGNVLPQLYGGSADLSVSDLTMMKQFPIIATRKFSGRNIKFGVREFGMATMANGLARTGFLTPFIGTFATFSDYMRNAIRLCAIMRLNVIYQFTHDSIFLGEDGPTHQAVEHYMSLRAIPNLHVIRPGDQNEVKMSWLAALRYRGPSAILLSRQKLPAVPGTDRGYSEGVGRGAYVLKLESAKPDYTLIATGSELHLAYDVATELEKMGHHTRVVSMPCWELFEAQDREYRDSVLGGDLGKRVSIEAGVDQGWYKYADVTISQETYGASAPAADLEKEFGFTVESVLERIL